jgi:hypothetical protein
MAKVRQRILWDTPPVKDETGKIIRPGRGKRTAWGYVAVNAAGKQVRVFKAEWSKEQAETELVELSRRARCGDTAEPE